MSGPASPGRRFRILLVTALPVVLGLASVVRAATIGRPGSGGEPLPLAYVPGLLFPWLAYALLAPAVFALVEAAPLTRETWLWRAALHGSAALVFVAVHLALTTTLHLVAYRPGDITWGAFYRNNLGAFLVSDLAQYVLLAGASHALLFQARLREREVAALKLEASLTEARMRALTGQLGPHFLFNALNTVKALARRGDADGVATVVTDLSDLLRITLSESESPVVSVERELERVERYLDIQSVRHGERLRVSVDAPARTREALLPAMALQPLVENALEHGLGRSRGALHVTVTLRREGPWLRVVVDDDGPGFPDDLEPGVGLGNLRRRLRELYGDRHALRLGASDLGGARVELRVPREGADAPAPGSDLAGARR